MIEEVCNVMGKLVGIKIVIGGWEFMYLLCEGILICGVYSVFDFIVVDGGEGGLGVVL